MSLAGDVTKSLDCGLPHATWSKVKREWRAGRHDKAIRMVAERIEAGNATFAKVPRISLSSIKHHIAMSVMVEDYFGKSPYTSFKNDTLLVSNDEPKALCLVSGTWLEYGLSPSDWKQIIGGVPGPITLEPPRKAKSPRKRRGK